MLTFEVIIVFLANDHNQLVMDLMKLRSTMQWRVAVVK